MAHTADGLVGVDASPVQQKTLSFVVVIVGVAQLAYLIILLIADMLDMAYWNVFFATFLFTVLWLNEKGYFEGARRLFAFTSPILIGFTAIFGPIAAEFAQMVVIVSSQLIWSAKNAIKISLVALVCFMIAKCFLHRFEYQDDLWVLDTFYAINITYCFAFPFLFIYLFKKQLAEQDGVIEQANEQLRQANDKLRSLYDAALDANPLTGLPGKNLIRRSVVHALHRESASLLVYVDIDNFKSFNDRYGFARGDEVIRFLAALLQDLFEQDATEGRLGEGRLIGHIGGDDFFLVLDKARDEQYLETIIAEFERCVLDFYDREDRARGFIQSFDRQGKEQQFPIMTLSLMGVDTSSTRCETFLEVSDICAELKKKAKNVQGSCLLFDSRE